VIRLKGNLVGLRPLRKNDVPVFHPLVTDPRVARFLPSLPDPYPIEEGYTWVRSTHRLARRREAFTFGIETCQDKAIVGIIALMHINWTDRVAELGYWIGRPYWRRGYGLEATQLALRFAFKELKLYRLFARVIESNSRSAGLLRKAGFASEGVSRKEPQVGGRRLDELQFGLLRTEWQSAKS